ncbi:acylase [Erythrobacter arachoides]|uniref:Acylase n=1 Tax=Aurantiacibacter arachoides TaxID=1850444 RepID=A0A844ZWZ8_9SPHN|nr:acylase [Aurantiacibacter arachoides]MXO92415.1 acylase [Aurantiacibacter arachoides]GGD57340.1 penicillin amidase [Aurantiacibacter arachoides]
MRKWFKRLAFAMLILLALAIVFLLVWEPIAAREGRAPPATRQYQAEIVRDAFGVPHIYGATDRDVAYGVAIAHAEDDFSTLQDVVAMARGRYGAIAGEDGAAVDFAYHLLDARGTAERQYPALPADTRALFDAYASGLNAYAEAHPGELKLDRLFPVNGTDVAAGFALRQPFFFGLGNTVAALVSGEPMDPEPGPPLVLPQGQEAAMAGSNAFAIAPEKSGDGVTRLVSNAHQPFRGGVAWYELVVESGEGWHFAGANFPGSPYPFLGHNEHLGWTNTVNQPDMTDVYRLVVNEDTMQYRLDGQWRDLESRRVWLPVKFGPLTLPVPRTIYRSVHGPVIHNDNGWFAVRYGGIDNLGNVDAYYRLNKATTFDEWRAIVSRLDVPSTNFIYADEAGTIAYFYNAAIPDRVEGPDWRGILPGDDSRLIWQGPVAADELPWIVNPASGWLFNANNTPFSAAGPGSDLDPADYSPVMGIETRMTNRARRAAQLMSRPGPIDRARLEAIKYDTGYLREGYIAAMLDGVAALDVSDDPLLDRAQALLARWDLTADNRGPADALALLMVRPFMGSDYNRETKPDVREELERSANHLVDTFGRLDVPMSDLLRLRQGEGDARIDLPLDGGSDTLRASTLWDIDDDGRLSLRHGDSFIMFVEWAPGQRVGSQSIQPFGAATTRPDSPHHTDQMRLYATHRLKPVHFWRDDVLLHAASRRTVSSD